jgi:hypothetical protein
MLVSLSMRRSFRVKVRNACPLEFEEESSLLFSQCSVIRLELIKTLEKHDCRESSYLELSSQSSVFHDIDLTESTLRFVHGLGRLRNESQFSNADRPNDF